METATNTTAFTCSPEASSLQFSDAHCTEGPGEAYGHEAIPAGTSTDIEVSSSETTTWKGSLLGASIEIVCHQTSSDTAATSFVENTLEGTKHDFHGTAAIVLEECTLTGNGSPNCEVGNGRSITLHMLFHAIENPPGKGGEMGIEFTPTEGSTTFVEIPFTGSGCLLSSLKLKGRMRATGASAVGGGATWQLLPADEELTFGGNAASLEGKFTIQMAGAGNGISTTTVT